MDRGASYIIVEDHDQEAKTLQDVLLDLGFQPHKCLARVTSESAAREEIGRNQPDVLFLDLSIPASQQDTQIDNEVGYTLLNWIHSELNRSGGPKTRVIIVSGRYGLQGTPDKKLRSGYEGTLVGVVNKDSLKNELSQVLRELNRDPLLEDLIRLQVQVVSEYQMIVSPASSVLNKCQAAKRLACKLMMNEGDVRAGKLGSCNYGDNLSRAIIELIRDRFNEVEIGTKQRPRQERVVRKNNMKAGDRWGKFLWRGVMLEHLYSINNYRNRTDHLSEHDYTCEPGGTEEWAVPPELLAYFTRGGDVVEIIRLQVRALLGWYLPWHEHVYLRWIASLKGKEGGTN